MVWVEGGSFYMGAQKKNKKGINYDKYAVEEESPVHRVSLPDFWIGQTEVTQALWVAVMGENPSSYKDPDCHVDFVDWYAGQAFIRKLDSITGLRLGLPTEEQWKYAAREETL